MLSPHRNFRIDATIRREFDTGPPAAAARSFSLSLRGLAGGHSGIQIHQQLGNAIKLLGQCLQGVAGVQLASLDVGVAHNVIPREGKVEFTCTAGAAEDLVTRLEQVRAHALSYLPAADCQLEFELQPAELESVLSEADSRAILDVRLPL